ncbi:MAG: beta-propeller fold lactonase family protein [Methylobacter sp.]|uniref:YncE family protein n=1 Tax=Methylobacter sp. TaxID=2051955 RepID=UPI002588990A|nr:beta-propeller fold lactonase family protein [Methylobacter sp.]MCL7421583.1 beta-propeller fold lactonase family protein [Methylobacter sp.]
MSTVIFQHHFRAWAWLAILCLTAASPAISGPSFTLFESGQVRPLTLSPNGRHLFAVNTPDNRLEVFRVRKSGLKHIGSVPVGLEPVAVAARSDTEVWVVNHLSDSVSVIDLRNGHTPRVVRTLLVGDEPRDIVFAGPAHSRAFITTAHRGQNTGRDPQLTMPGVGRADVWVFDANQLGDSLEGDELTVITLFTDTPRALAATADGQRVYAAGFQTGNKTTTINEFLARQGTRPLNPLAMRVYPGSQPNLPGGGDLINHAGISQPTVGLIVKHDGAHWLDELGQIWDDMVPFTLPDKDVFTIDAMADPPREVEGGTYSGVGTVLFNMIVNPDNGDVYVANTDAQNQKRFEGVGLFTGGRDEGGGIFSGGRTVRGHLHESHITVLDGSGGGVMPRHLNKHIDYSKCCAPIPNTENATSVAFPQDMAITGDGSTLYAAMFGTSEIGVYQTQELKNDTFVPDTANQIPVSGGGPSGLALDEAKGRLYVLTRFDNAISVIDTGSRSEISHIAMHNPEPRHIVEGRRFLYDASFTSSHGDSACASCHVFGDFDSLAWDLGDPDNDQTDNTGPFRVDEGIGFFLSRALGVDPQTGQFQLLPNPVNPHFAAMKGPVTTQSLRGLDNHGAMHWRGDRTGGNNDILNNPVEPNQQPNGGSFDENLAFLKFNVAFFGLNGRNAFIPEQDMQKFADFMLEVTYPPNPIRNLDNSLTPQQQAGRDFFCGPTDTHACIGGNKSDTFLTCNGCHVLDRNGNAEFPEVKKPGFFGTDGQFSFEGESQFFKIPHLRNLYQKVGMFGMPPNPEPGSLVAPPGSLIFFPLANTPLPEEKKQQVRGFGFLHDGSVDTVFRFVSASVFLQRPPSPNLGIDPRTPAELLDADGKDPGNAGGLPNPAVPDQDLVTLRRDIETFLLAFDSNLAPIVGQQATLTKSNAAVAGPRIDLLMARADMDECDLVAKNRFGGFLYIR